MVRIECLTGAPEEVATRSQLLGLLESHDTSRYWFTDHAVIEHGAIPHSHPVLTLGTREYPDQNLLLADFVHEQLHWFFDEREQAVNSAVDEIRAAYPRVPVGHPDGARDEHSSYLHLALCVVEHVAMVDIVGAEAACAVRTFWQSDHYRWIYRTVESDWDALMTVVERHGLVPAG